MIDIKMWNGQEKDERIGSKMKGKERITQSQSHKITKWLNDWMIKWADWPEKMGDEKETGKLKKNNYMVEIG